MQDFTDLRYFNMASIITLVSNCRAFLRAKTILSTWKPNKNLKITWQFKIAIYNSKNTKIYIKLNQGLGKSDLSIQWKFHVSAIIFNLISTK